MLLVSLKIALATATLLANGSLTRPTNANTGDNRINTPSPYTVGTGKALLDESIPYKVANRYFVNNTVNKPLNNPKIDSQKKFDEVFGAAAVMGSDGLPTPIDFSRQYVIAVVVPATERRITLEPVSLLKNEAGKLVFTYRKAEGAKRTYTSSAALIILVDKKVNGDVILQQKK